MLNWTLRLWHQWILVLVSNSIYYVHMMVVCSWKTIENYLVKILENSISRVSTNREFPSIDRMFLFDRSNKNRELIESTQEFMMNLLKFRLIKNSFRLIEFAFSIDWIGIENRSSHPDCLLKLKSQIYVKTQELFGPTPKLKLRLNWFYFNLN